ncbi:FAD-dependent monooxygenase [Archangium violaceum]|uniref:FAD-dependent monooxygenase n=1 Tax=Archangium violaceum TaxID=83451 RepID=UPI0036DDDE2E
MSTNPRSALVVGLGIAGMASAIGLRKAGWQVTVIEKASSRRVGGYFIGLFGTGYSAARRLGVMDDMHTRTPREAKTWEITRTGDRQPGVGFLDQPGEPYGVLRGDIEAALFQNLGDVEVRYGTEPTQIIDVGDGTRVTLLTTATGEEREQRFDLVVGADGVRSTVRRLVFGPHERFLRPLNAIICAYQLEEQVPGYAMHHGLVLAEQRRSLWIFPFDDRPPTALFSYRTRDIDAQFRAPPREVLRRVYGPEPFGGAIEHALNQLDRAPNFLFDSVNQVHMSSWHSGRTVLVGDAAWCVTLYSGMGASMGLAGGSLLGELLTKHPDDIETALRTWDARLRPTIRSHQRTALFNGQIFTPTGPLAYRFRQAIMSLGKKDKAPGTPPTALERFFARPRNIEFAA